MSRDDLISAESGTYWGHGVSLSGLGEPKPAPPRRDRRGDGEQREDGRAHPSGRLSHVAPARDPDGLAVPHRAAARADRPFIYRATGRASPLSICGESPHFITHGVDQLGSSCPAFTSPRSECRSVTSGPDLRGCSAGPVGPSRLPRPAVMRGHPSGIRQPAGGLAARPASPRRSRQPTRTLARERGRGVVSGPAARRRIGIRTERPNGRY